MPKRPSGSRSLRTLLGNRALPACIRALTPGALAQMCSRVGLSDAAELMALAPARQLVRALDAGVWKTPRPGQAEVFDPRELLEWLAVWLDIGDEFTAQRLGAIPDADLTLYLSHVLRVGTADMWGFERSTEIGDLDRIYASSYHESAYGQYVATATDPSQWETVRAALDALWRHAPERLLSVFSLLSGDETMLAPQTHRESSNRDFISEREGTRERRGHVAAAGARAFLALANAPINELLALSCYDLETSRHLAVIDDVDERALTAGESFAADDEGDEQLAADEAQRSDSESAASATEGELTALRAELEAAGLLDPERSTRLLTHTPGHQRAPDPRAGPPTSADPAQEQSLLVKRLAELAGEDPLAFDACSRELAYLANVLIAAVALESRQLTAEEAQAAALATCNLGLELTEKHAVSARIDREPGLVRLFLVGWQALGSIPARVVDGLTRSLSRLQAAAILAGQLWMLDEAMSNLIEVRAAVSRRDFDAAREAALLLSFVFDPRACRAVVPLLDELPHLAGPQNAVAPQPRQGIAGQAERPQWLGSLADVRRIDGLLRSIGRRRKR